MEAVHEVSAGVPKSMLGMSEEEIVAWVKKIKRDIRNEKASASNARRR